jgi:hypothetical protein
VADLARRAIPSPAALIEHLPALDGAMVPWRDRAKTEDAPPKE